MKYYTIILSVLLLFGGGRSALAETAQQQMLSLAAAADENGVVQGKDGWLFLKEELEHLGSKAFYGKDVLKSSKAAKPEYADPIPAIVDFNQQLKARGIQLVFAPIPPKALINSDKLPGVISPEMLSVLDKMYGGYMKSLQHREFRYLI